MLGIDRDGKKPARSVARTTLAAVFGLAFGGLSFCSIAQAGTVDVNYSITLAGLTIGKATLSGVVEPGSYTLNASASLTGLIGAISKGSGAATARGVLVDQGVLSNGFSLRASNGTTTRTIQIGVASGTVRGVTIEPPFETNQSDRVPLRDPHKAGVVDPVSALVMPSRTADPLDKANCERKLPVFDGTQRFDIVLTYAGIRQVKGESGYSGPVLVCAARYVPVAGHRPDRKVTKFMIENRAMDAWLAPVNGGKTLIPYRISVKTMIGTSVIEASRFTSSGP